MASKVDFFMYASTFQGELPDGLQKIFWQRAVKAKNIDLLVALTSRKKASEYVLEQASERNDIKVKVAFLSREDTSNDVRIMHLASETRAGVYAGMIDSASKLLNDEVFERVYDVFCAKQTVSLAECLVSTVSIPTPLSVKCLSFLSHNVYSFKSDDFTRDYMSKLREVSTDPEVFSMLVQDFSTKNNFFPRIFEYNSVEYDINFSLIVAKHPELLKKVFKELYVLNDAKHIYYSGRYAKLTTAEFLSKIVVKIVNNNPSEDLLKFLKDSAKLHSIIDEHAQNVLSGFDASAAITESNRLAELRLVASTTNSQSLLSELFKENDPTIFDNLLKNPNLSEPLVYDLVMHLSDSNAEASSAYELVKSFKSFNKAMLLAYYKFPKDLIALDNWSYFSDVHAAKKELFRMFATPADFETRRGSPSYSVMRLSDFIESLDQSDVALLELNWALYCGTFSTWGRFDSSKVTKSLLTYQLEVLGDDMVLWDSFDTLSRNYQGSLKDLVDTVKYM